MIPRELIDTAEVPGAEPLERNELMNSRMSGSEEG